MRHAGRALQITIVSGLCVGLWDGALAVARLGEGAAGLPGIAASGAMLAWVGLAVGVPLSAAATLAHRTARRLAEGSPAHASIPHGTFQAALLVALSILTASVIAVLLVTVRKALTFDETSMAVATVVFSGAVVLVLSAVAAIPGAVCLAAAAARTARLAALPPRRVWSTARWSLSTVVCVASAWYVARHGEHLGRAAVAVYALMIAALALPWLPGNASRSRLASRVRMGVIVLTVGMFAASAQGLSTWPGAGHVVSQTAGAGAVADWLRVRTDFDGDGESSLFGGSDCAPFDPDRAVAIPAPRGREGTRCLGPNDTAEEEKGAPRLPPISGLLPKEHVRPYNVVLIVVDALRADRLRSSGYARRLTPEIERLAQDGFTFSNAWSQSSATRISFPSFLTGRNPSSLHWKKDGRRYGPAESEDLLQEQLTDGYATAFIANNWFNTHVPSLLRGFDEFVNVWFDKDYRRWRKGSAPVTTARSIEFLSKHVDQPFFLAAYYEGPHAPYEDLTERGIVAFGTSKEDRYDQEVQYADRHVGFLLDYLRSHPDVWKRTVVFITADHGEEFGEHGDKHHGHNCHRTTTHVPLIMRVPGMEAGRTVEAPVALVDIVPTVLELLGRRPQDLELDGRSLFYSAVGGLEEKDRPIHCTLFKDQNPRQSLLQSVRVGHLLLVSPPDEGGLKLYDTRSDPQEKNGLAEREAFRPDLDRLRPLIPAASAVRFDR